MPAAQLLARDDQLRAALPPLRRQLLELLREPASAAELARRTGIARQKLNYHLRVLERAGLVQLVETRTRRGCTERVLRSSSAELVVDPDLVSATDRVRARDRYAAEHLTDVAAQTIREVTRLRSGAEQTGRRLLTFTVETEISFARPADVHAFTDALAACVADLGARFGQQGGGAGGAGARPYRIIVGGHPAGRPTVRPGEEPQP